MILNVHGHTHASPGVVQMGKITVMNPGSIK